MASAKHRSSPSKKRAPLQRVEQGLTEAQRLAFLANAGEVLASSLDYEQTLRDVARLAVPALGDLCMVDIVEDGELRRVATLHVVAKKKALLEELRRRDPGTLDSPRPAARVVRSGEPELMVDVTDDMIVAHTSGQAHASLIMTVGVRSHIAVPLVARGAVLGAISLAITESDRKYGVEDVALARDLARRAAVAVDNARLYRAAQTELRERRKAEDRVRASEERLRLAINAARLSVWEWDRVRDRMAVSDNAREFWGREITSTGDLRALIHPDDRPAVKLAVEAAIAGAEAFQADFRIVGPGGRTRWMHNRGQARPGADGQPGQLLGVTVDITELKEAELANRVRADAGEVLAASLDEKMAIEGLSNLLVPHLADWCVVDLLQESGELELVHVAHADPSRTEALRQLIGRHHPRRTTAHGRWQVLQTKTADWRLELGDSSQRAGAEDDEPLRELRTLGLRAYVCVPLVAHGTGIGVLTTVQEGSGRTFSPEQIELLQDLGRRLGVAIENARLYQRLRLADKRKDEFLATLAHELRNPLAPIRTGLEILRRDPAPQTAEKTREMMERQLSHMVRLIDDLLDLSRVTRGKIQLSKERVDLWNVVSTALEASRSAIEDAGLQLVMKLPQGAILVEADRTRLAQVVSNLLNNAAKYTDRGGKVELSVSREGSEAVVCVRDTGVGIPKDMLPQIFEMFVQVGTSIDRSQGGLGIGLTLVRRLVELHGGIVWAESDGPQKGSAFFVRLPVVGAPSQSASTIASAHPAAPGTPRRVLVVDDNVDAAEALSLFLEVEGHEVRRAHSGPEALTLVESFKPEIAFLDIGMPGMTGYELAQRLKQHPLLPNLRLVAITGWGREEDRRQSTAAGFDHHLTKPVDPNVMARLVAAMAPAPRTPDRARG